MSPSAEFENLVRAHSPNLRRYCVRLAGPSDADDLLQETLTRAMVHFGTLRDRDRFLPWCRQIARNTHLRRLQQARPTEPIVEVVGDGDLEAEVVDSLVRRAEVAAVLAGLNERHRRVLTARAEGVPPAELASQLGVSRQLVDTWFARSRLQARNLLRSLRDTGVASSLGVGVLRWARRYAWVAAAIAVGAGVAVTLAPWRVAAPTHAPAPAGRSAAHHPAGQRPTPPTAGAAPARASHPVASWSAGPAGPHATPVTPRSTRERLDPGLHRMPATAIDATAAVQPIVIGPLLPGDGLIIGFDPCAYVELVTPCGPLIGGLRAHIL